MKYSMASDRGKVRQTNQDNSFAASFDKNSCFAVVCDGMGGTNAGDIASTIAVKTISEHFADGWRADITVESIKNLLITSICAANVCIYDAAAEDESLSGMGTTVVAAVVMEDDLFVAHVGDSRAYVVSDDIKSVTKDHSYVQSLVDAGTLTEAQARYSPYKNIITRALGIGEHVDVDFTKVKFRSGERVLLCSDGLTNYVSESNILKIIKDSCVMSAADSLVAAANSAGGGDNITVIVIER